MKRLRTTHGRRRNPDGKDDVSPLALISITELACESGVSRPTVYRWTREGNFPAPVRTHREGKGRYFRREVIAWLRSRQRRDSANG